MSHWDGFKRGSKPASRREFLSGVGAATVPLVTGCLGGGEEIDWDVHNILVRNEDNRERTITVEVTNARDVKDDHQVDTPPNPENIVWEHNFTFTLASGDHAVERDIFTDSGWYYARASLEDGESSANWVSGCYYSIRIFSEGSLGISWDSSC